MTKTRENDRKPCPAGRSASLQTDQKGQLLRNLGLDDRPAGPRQVDPRS